MLILANGPPPHQEQTSLADLDDRELMGDEGGLGRGGGRSQQGEGDIWIDMDGTQIDNARYGR